MSAKSKAATAPPSPGRGTAPPTVHPELARGLASLLLRWRNRHDGWVRLGDRSASPREQSAARGNASATLAAIEDLEAVLAGRQPQERPGG